jgi:hypothetical protein
MFAYSMAAAHTELPHITLVNHMVSNTEMATEDEGWQFIDNFGDDVCQPPIDNIYYPDKLLPTFLHYCQFFRSGEIGFQKRRIPKSLFNCESPLLMELPIDQGKVNYKNRDGEV